VCYYSQHRQGVKAYMINPFNVFNGFLPQHTLNPLDILKPSSPTLDDDIIFITRNIFGFQSQAGNNFFDKQAMLIVQGILRTEVHYQGLVTLESLYHVINLMRTDLERFTAYVEAMGVLPCPNARAIGKEVLKQMAEAPKQIQGVIGTIANAFSFMNSQNIRQSVSGTPDFSLQELAQEQGQTPVKVFVSLTSDYTNQYPEFLRLIFSVAMLCKSRKPKAKRVVFLMDESAQFKSFPALQDAITLKSGEGVKVWHVWQNREQIDQYHGRNAAQTFIESSQVLQVLAFRGHDTAKYFSDMLGFQTISYRNEQQESELARSKRDAVHGLLKSGDYFEASRKVAHINNTAVEVKHKGRKLKNADELNALEDEKMILWVNGKIPRPFIAYKVPYYETKALNGLWLPNLSHTAEGYSHSHVELYSVTFKKKPVIEQAPPERLKNYPQFKNGTYYAVKGVHL